MDKEQRSQRHLTSRKVEWLNVDSKRPFLVEKGSVTSRCLENSVFTIVLARGIHMCPRPFQFHSLVDRQNSETERYIDNDRFLSQIILTKRVGKPKVRKTGSALQILSALPTGVVNITPQGEKRKSNNSGRPQLVYPAQTVYQIRWTRARARE